jgi:hypothetical protein
MPVPSKGASGNGLPFPKWIGVPCAICWRALSTDDDLSVGLILVHHGCEQPARGDGATINNARAISDERRRITATTGPGVAHELQAPCANATVGDAEPKHLLHDALERALAPKLYLPSCSCFTDRPDEHSPAEPVAQR